MRHSRHTSRTATIITIESKMNTLSAPETRAQLGAAVLDGGQKGTIASRIRLVSKRTSPGRTTPPSVSGVHGTVL